MTRKHLDGIDQVGARLVLTKPLRAVLSYGRRAVERRGILVLTGPAGRGKTFAGLTLCESLDNWVYVPVDEGMSPYAFLQRLLECLLEQAPDPNLKGHRLETTVLRALRQRRPVLFIDDANYLSRRLIAQFIYLQAYADFALILAGFRLNRILLRAEELETRSTRTIPFVAIRRSSLVARLAAFHDLFARTEPGLLLRINDVWAKGNFRRWARIVEVIANDHPALLATGLTADLMPAVLGAASGSPWGRLPDAEVA